MEAYSMIKNDELGHWQQLGWAKKVLIPSEKH